jgi:hypothetical protein
MIDESTRSVRRIVGTVRREGVGILRRGKRGQRIIGHVVKLLLCARARYMDGQQFLVLFFGLYKGSTRVGAFRGQPHRAHETESPLNTDLSKLRPK